MFKFIEFEKHARHVKIVRKSNFMLQLFLIPGTLPTILNALPRRVSKTAVQIVKLEIVFRLLSPALLFRHEC